MDLDDPEGFKQAFDYLRGTKTDFRIAVELQRAQIDVSHNWAWRAGRGEVSHVRTLSSNKAVVRFVLAMMLNGVAEKLPADSVLANGELLLQSIIGKEFMPSFYQVLSFFREQFDKSSDFKVILKENLALWLDE